METFLGSFHILSSIYVTSLRPNRTHTLRKRMTRLCVTYSYPPPTEPTNPCREKIRKTMDGCSSHQNPLQYTDPKFVHTDKLNLNYNNYRQLSAITKLH